MSEKTLGERRVRIDFNVSGETAIDEIKAKTADLINIVKACPIERHCEPGESARLQALAMTAYEEAAMWAVKMVTADAEVKGAAPETKEEED